MSLQWIVTREPVQEQPSAINHLTCAAVVKPNSIALWSRVDLPNVLIFQKQSVLMNSVKDVVVRQGSSCGTEKSLIGVNNIKLKLDKK